jgi:flagellar biosynthetic protein FliO
MGLDVLWVVLSLVGVLGLFFILVYATKRLNSGIGYVNGNRMKIVDRVSLGRDGMLVVVSVAGKLMLFGVTGQHIEKLADIDMTPEEYSERTSSPENNGNTMSFASAFAEVIRKKKGREKDNGDD